MYQRLAKRLTAFLESNDFIDESKKTICSYGMEILIANIVYAFLFLLISITTRTLFNSLIWAIGLYAYRKIAGGYHAKSYFLCHMISLIAQLFFIIIILYLPKKIMPFCSYVCLLSGGMGLLLLAPVDHNNKVFVGTEYARFRKSSIIYALLIFASAHIGLVLFGWWDNNSFLFKSVFSFSFGTFLATISLLSAKIIRYKERKYSYGENDVKTA